MLRVLGIVLFLIPVVIRCWLVKKTAWPEYKGYAVVSVMRLALIIGIGIAALWARGMTTEILAIVFMALLVVSLLIPVSRPKLNS
jgi:hypothetical protein